MTEPHVCPIDKNAQYVILRRLGWVSLPREHFQNFDFIVILYFDAPRGMVFRYRDTMSRWRDRRAEVPSLGADGGLEQPAG